MISNFLDRMRGGLRRWYHAREIQESLRLYEARTGQKADARAAYAESGTFGAQVDRLFEIGSMAETQALTDIAQICVSACVTNTYYLPADCLSDVVDALSDWTCASTRAEGEPPLSEELEPHERAFKLKVVTESWIMPIKIAALEETLADYARRVGRTLPRAALGRFERQAARVFALTAQSETVVVAQLIQGFVKDWIAGGPVRHAHREPADGLRQILAYLEGDARVPEGDTFIVRGPRQPLRLATLMPDQRGRYLELSFRALTPKPVDAAPATPLAPATPIAATGALPAAAVAVHTPARSDELAGLLAITLACPECGAPCVIDDETVSLLCAYCSSLLVFAAPDHEEIYRQEGFIADGEAALDVILMYRTNAYRAEVISKYSDQDGNPPPLAFIERMVAEHAKRLHSSSRLLAAHVLHAPYWHISGKILQAVLGRERDGGKSLRLRAYGVDHTVAAYRPNAADLRDQGLRLSRTTLRPLTARDAQALGAFLPWIDITQESFREIDRWRKRHLDPDFEPVTKRGDFLFARRVLVYRPYWLVEVFADRGAEWVLLDGAFSTIAGYPLSDEIPRLLRQATTDPLRATAESYRRVAAITSRCPDCGHDQRIERRFRVVLCANCQRALELLPNGMRVVPYSHVPPARIGAPCEYLPFWRFAFEARLPDGQRVRTLPEYAAGAFGANARLLPIQGDALFIPAFRLLGTQIGDAAFAELCAWIHRRPPQVSEERIPLGERFVCTGVSVGESEAREMAQAALMSLQDDVSAAQLNALTIQRSVFGVAITLAAARLVMVSFEGEGDTLRDARGDVSIPRLLIQGGPRLDAQRASVHKLPPQP
ncbi:MAG: hypothetical protein MUF51_05140 [Vicinamibacteria bacterium]|jgi:hypothetical protein|nr:hypothetical protein [Vicinamibacteria bacterium]